MALPDNDRKYFAAKPTKGCAENVIRKIETWTNTVTQNKYLEKLRKSYAAYHGVFFEADGHKISFSGEQGELVNLPVNHYHNFATHLLNMTTSNRPSMEAQAVNTDYKSMAQTILANDLLEYYMSQKSLESYLKKAVEYAIVFGEGYVKMEWNATSGEIFDFNEETQTYIYEGDIVYKNLSPFDVIRDSSREDVDHDWIVTRSYKNRFDLIAKYPEFENEILAVKSKDHDTNFSFNALGSEDTDLVPVWEFYHKRTDAVPNGRYMLMVSADAVFHDGPLPYRFIPVFRIAPGDFLGTSYGYTIMFDLLPIQDAANSLYSVIATNQNAFGVQSVLSPRGTDINVTQLTGGLNFVEYNATAGKPEPLNLTQTPAEVFKMLELLERTMETLSGINSVARGNPEASLKSGAALALVQAQAVQFASGLQQSYIKLVEDVGSATVTMLQDFASAPRVAAIVGKANRVYMKEFSGQDLDKIKRVIVRVGNPLAKTTAGRMEIANNLMQMGLVTNLNQYFTVLDTGRLDSMTEGAQSQLLLIRRENEKMVRGEPVRALATDRHSIHIQEHDAILADPDMRDNPELLQLVSQHMLEHIDLLKTTDPALLAMIGEQSLAPPPMPPMTGEAPMTQAQGQVGTQTAELQEPLPIGSEQVANMPSLPQPAAPFQDMPISPDEGGQGSEGM